MLRGSLSDRLRPRAVVQVCLACMPIVGCSSAASAQGRQPKEKLEISADHPPPFRRHFDFQGFVISGFPHSLGGCLEGHLGWKGVVGGCGSIGFFGPAGQLYGGLRRPFYGVRIGSDRYRVWSFGGSLGVSAAACPVYDHDNGGKMSRLWLASLDGFATFEMVQWKDRGPDRRPIGATLQFDFGGLVGSSIESKPQAAVMPLYNVSLGVAW